MEYVEEKEGVQASGKDSQWRDQLAVTGKNGVQAGWFQRGRREGRGVSLSPVLTRLCWPNHILFFFFPGVESPFYPLLNG